MASAIPWIAAWLILNSGGKTPAQNIKNFGDALIGPPIDKAVNAWLKVVVITAGMGFVVWLTESKIAKGQGFSVKPPELEPIRVHPGPSFGASGGYGVSAGPVAGGSSVSLGGGAPDYKPSGGGGGRSSLVEQVASAERGPSRRERRAESRARVAEANARTARAQSRSSTAREGEFHR